MASKKSYQNCIADLDYETAIWNFENTTNRWKKYWFNCLVELYEKCEEFTKKYILDPIKLTVIKIQNSLSKSRKSKYDDVIIDNGFDIRAKNGEQCYLFEFYDDNNNLICSKVGTTKRTVRQRLIEELRSKTYTSMGVTKAIINRIYNCGDLPSEGLESLIRSEYIKKYPKSFKKNDRFIGERFDFNLCDEIAENYLAV